MTVKKQTSLNQLRIDKSQLKASLTLVINKQGQVAGTATTVPDATKLVAAAKTPVKVVRALDVDQQDVGNKYH